MEDLFDASAACPRCGNVGANKYRHDAQGHITYSGGTIVGCLACGLGVHVFEPNEARRPWGVPLKDWPFLEVQPPTIGGARIVAWDNIRRYGPGSHLFFECQFQDDKGMIYDFAYFGREGRWRLDGVRSP